jgi:O-antigen ligase
MTLNSYVRRPILVCFLVVLVVAPIPLGSNRDWSWSPLAVVIGLLLLAWTATALAGTGSVRRSFAPTGHLLVPAVLMALVFGWILVQISGWTPAEWASPISGSAVLGPSAASRAVAFEREPPLTGLMHLLTYLAVFVLAASLPEHGADARRILGAIVWSAIVGTIFGLVATSINRLTPYTGFEVWTPNPLGFFSGTFVNVNSYATNTGVAALAALALALPPPSDSEYRETAAQRWRRRIGELSGFRLLWLAATVLLVTGVLLSGSRAGWASLVLGMLTVSFAYARGIGRVGFVLVMALALGALAVAMPGGDKLIDRTMLLLSTGENSRRELWQMAIDGIALRPFLGWGMNGFAALYTMFQPPALSAVYADKVHDTYLELAFELGIPATVILLAAILWIVVRCCRGFYSRGRDRELAGLGVFATVLVAFHAIFDFSVQIPGMACTYFAILGVAWNQSWSSRQQ